jgi:hypothetical protein
LNPDAAIRPPETRRQCQTYHALCALAPKRITRRLRAIVNIQDDASTRGSNSTAFRQTASGFPAPVHRRRPLAPERRMRSPGQCSNSREGRTILGPPPPRSTGPFVA